LEKEVLRWWKGSMAEGAVVGWAWEWMDLDADAREGPRGQGGQVRGWEEEGCKSRGLALAFGCERKRKSVGFQRGDGLLSYGFPPEIWILCAPRFAAVSRNRRHSTTS